MNDQETNPPTQRLPRPSGTQGSGEIWVLLLGWFFFGAGIALATMALLDLLSPLLGLSPAARGALLCALWTAMWAGYRRGRGGENPAVYLGVAALVILAAPWLFPLLGPVVGVAQGSLLGIPLLLFGIRLLLALLLLLVPMGCLGAALRAPWICLRGISTDLRGIAHRDAILAAGATVGLVQGGFRLRPWGGGTVLAVAAALLLLVTAALAGWLKKSAGSSIPGDTRPPGAAGFLTRSQRLIWGISATAAVLAWCHLLAPALGPFSQTSSRVLAVFLGGVALGSLAISLRSPFASFGAESLSVNPILAGLAGLLVGVSAYLADWLPTLYLDLPPAGGGSLGFDLGQWGLTALLVLPGAVVWGLWLPHLSGIQAPPAATASPEREGGGEAGAVLVGVAVAVALFPSWVLPSFGFRATLMGTGALLIAFSVVGWALSGERSRSLRMAGAAAGMLITLIPAWILNPGDIRLLSSGVYRYASAIHERYPILSQYRAERKKASIPFYKEGGESLVAVEEIPIEDGILLSLTRDGTAIGSSTLDLTAQILASEIPLLLKPDAREALVIGYGTGVTLGSALLHPLERLHVVETEPAVVEASRQFEPANREPRRDSRLALHFEDPRQVLWSRPRGSLDLILSLGDSPEAAWSRFLTTAEFYRLCASRLSPDGIYVQEIPVAGLAPTELASLLMTMRTAFPEMVLFQSYYEQLLVVASREVIHLNPETIRETMAEPRIASDLFRIGITRPSSILVRHRLSGRGLEAFLRPGRILSDTGGPLGWSGYRPGWPPVADEVEEAIDRFSTGLPERIEGLEPGEKGDQVLLDLGQEAIGIGDAVRGADVAEALLARGRLAEGHNLLGEAHLLRGEQAAAVREWHQALESEPGHLKTLVALARYLVQHQNYEGAEEYLRQAVAQAPEDMSLRYSLGQALFYRQKFAESEKELGASLQALGPQKAPLALYYLGSIKKEESQWQIAAAYLESYLQWAYHQRRLTAVEADAHLKLADIYLALGRPQDADEQKKSGDVLTERLKAVANLEQKELMGSPGSP